MDIKKMDLSSTN
uniref:Uncharacterized protein n=1 Tax=Moniliophthora roreri TaxID=221103 RepID=A0A0W0FVJ5_MONRR